MDATYTALSKRRIYIGLILTTEPDKMDEPSIHKKNNRDWHQNLWRRIQKIKKVASNVILCT